MSQSEPSQPAATPRRFLWRRLFQFRLRTLLILTTIIAVALGWWSHKARQQRDAVAALTAVGAEVFYDFTGRLEDELFGATVARPPYWPAWLIDLLGVDYFANVQTVFHNATDHTQNTDAELKYLQDLSGLQVLHLGYTTVSDAGLENLKSFKALTELGLQETQITDTGLDHLKGLTALQHLDLRSTPITDAGLERLKGHTSLQMLWLNGTQVTDAGVARLQKGLPNCKIER